MMDEPWHSYDMKTVFDKLNAKAEGFSDSKARDLLEKYSLNQLQEEKKTTAIKILAQQFMSPLVLVLIAATAISASIGHVLDASIIGVIIVLNAVFGFVQEFKAEKAMEALRNMIAPMALAMRNGKPTKIQAIELVRGDMILLNEGDRVPADARLFDSSNLEVDEASLTGESVPVAKEVGIVKDKAIISSRSNMVFASTAITHGHCTAIVVNTGMSTEIGHIAKVVHETGESRTPLQAKLASVAKFLGIAVIFIAAAVFGVGLFRGGAIFDMFLTSISLAVAAVPEGLPAVVTITLAIGLKTMAQRKAVVRKLPVAETLGSATVIASDKTGTITKNEMTVQQIYTNNQIIEVSGSGYDPEGKFSVDGKKFSPMEDKHTKRILEVGSLCNLASLNKEKGKWQVIGDPTEAALIVAASKAGMGTDKLHKQYTHVYELSFDSVRKRMSTIHKHPTKKNMHFVAVKGAPETLIQYCTMIYEKGKARKITQKDKAKIKQIQVGMASKALRVLGLAYREISARTKVFKPENIEKELTFIGLVGMIDPPRPEVKEAIALCHKAGIKVVMITGDNRETATAVGKSIGLLNSGFEQIMTGDELDNISEKELKQRVNDIVIYARVSPEHKTKIIDGLKAKGHIVAMTGDGVNDAPALKKADIGVAMGLKGTDVAKEASDIVLEDDNFATIVAAVEEGRKIYDNIKKFIRYLLSCNAGEILVIFLASLIGLPLPLLAVQILWMNLMTDGLPALALGVDPADKNIMLRKPRDPKEKPLDKTMILNVILVGLVMMAGVLWLFEKSLPQGINYARSVAFTGLVMFQLFNVFNSRSGDGSIFNIGMPSKWVLLAIASSIGLQALVIYTPFFQGLFGTVAIKLFDLLILVGVAASVLLAVELQKVIQRRLIPSKS